MPHPADRASTPKGVHIGHEAPEPVPILSSALYPLRANSAYTAKKQTE